MFLRKWGTDMKNGVKMILKNLSHVVKRWKNQSPVGLNVP